jgi:secreted Zn-dependent insulinase-like peptidase
MRICFILLFKYIYIYKKKQGGLSNAYTDSGDTNYYFQSTNINFSEILDVWSRFFIDPLLKED